MNFDALLLLHKYIISKGKADLFIPLNLLNLLLKSSSLVCCQLILILIFLQVSMITFDLPAPLGKVISDITIGKQKPGIF